MSLQEWATSTKTPCRNMAKKLLWVLNSKFQFGEWQRNVTMEKQLQEGLWTPSIKVKSGIHLRGLFFLTWMPTGCINLIFKSVLLLNLISSCSSLPGIVYTWEWTCANEFAHTVLDQTCSNFTWSRLVLAVGNSMRDQHLKASRTNPCLITEYSRLGLIWV